MLFVVGEGFFDNRDAYVDACRGDRTNERIPIGDGPYGTGVYGPEGKPDDGEVEEAEKSPGGCPSENRHEEGDVSMAGTPHKGTKRKTIPRKLPAEVLRNEWYAWATGIFVPVLLPVAEQLAREFPSRIELEQRRDKWAAPMPAMMPWFFPMP